MDGDSRRRSVKVVRVLCDGCERASASVYCTECNESACASCAEQLHVRGRRSSKRSPQRNCKGRSMKDLQKTVGVLALCSACRTRPAYRYSNDEVYALCQECRRAYAPPEASAGHDVVKRAIADDLRRAKSKSSSSQGSGSSSSRRRQKHQGHHQHHKSRRERIFSEDDSTGDDITDMSFSREGSTE